MPIYHIKLVDCFLRIYQFVHEGWYIIADIMKNEVCFLTDIA